MTEDQIVEGFSLSLRQLVPNTDIRHWPVWPEELSGQPWPGSEAGSLSSDAQRVLLWFTYRAGHHLFFSIERHEVDLTDTERRLLALVPRAIEEFRTSGSERFLGLSLKYSSKIGFGDILMALFLSPLADPERIEAMSSQISIFLMLQDLAFRYYEDRRCSSGFVYTDNPEAWKAVVGQTSFQFEAFAEPVPCSIGLFGSPASFRYVDGRNSYYLIDDEFRLHGILRLRNPDSYSLVARLRNQHLRSLLEGMPGHTWVAFVGLREEVYVIVSPELQIKWQRNHWELRDRSIIFGLLDRFGLDRDLRELFISLLFALSEGGYGAGLLIPEDPNNLPRAIGKIDNTDIANQLRDLIHRSSMVDLNATNALLGIVASDGLTTVSKDGIILSCGDIIDISSAAILQSQGGGRSQAAIAASFYGLSIKISQNGPISFFNDGKQLLQF